MRSGRTNQSGLKLLIAKANAGDVIYFLATVNRIAEILKLQGDMESVDVRRSRAIGILAQPALALQLLWEFRNEQRSAPEPQQPDEPIDNEPDTPYETSGAPHGEDDQAQAEPAELIIQPPTMDVRKLRPKVMLYIHLSEEALLGYNNGKFALGGIGRFERVGPVTLGQVRRSRRHQLRRTSAASHRPAGHAAGRQLRDSAADPGSHVPADASQLLPVRRSHRTPRA